MSIAFLSPATAGDTAVARSPMERKAKAAGARFENRDGWNVAVEYPGEDRVRETVGFTDSRTCASWRSRATRSPASSARPSAKAMRGFAS